MWNCPYSNDSFPTYAGEGGAGKAGLCTRLLTCLVGFVHAY